MLSYYRRVNMVFGRLRDMVPNKRKEEKPEEEYVELTEEGSKSDARIGVRIETLSGYSDIDRIQELIRSGDVVFLRIRDLRAKDISELKKSVDKLRKMCSAINGDIVGVEEDFLVITPHIAQIYRGRTA